MTRLTIQTPSRLHFGLLSWGGLDRQFGGVGLMIDQPGLLMTAEAASDWTGLGPHADRVVEVARQVEIRLGRLGIAIPPLRFTILQAPPAHVGLGLGTQTALAVARLIRRWNNLPDLVPGDLAELAGRGLRSGIGLHGFALGGLIVDGGRAPSAQASVAPLLARLEFPAEWSVLVVVPPGSTGLHGPSEIQAFRQLPPAPDATVDRLCRLVLLDLLPAVVEHDLATFGTALMEIQERVGQGFAAAQGGIFARADLADVAVALQEAGLVGVGQSSWGPTLYGFSAAPAAERAEILKRLRTRTGWPAAAVFWTRASREGARLDGAD